MPSARACAAMNTGEFLSVFTPTVSKCGSLILISFDAQQTRLFKALKIVTEEGYLPSKSISVLMMPNIRQCTAFPEPVWFYSQLNQTTQLL